MEHNHSTLKIKCLIIDDEYLARQLLEGYINKIPYLELIGSYDRAVEGLAILQRQQVDLILLDINMPELSGLGFLRALQNKPEVILTTAYSEHALEAYQLNVIEYLLKPIYFDRFLQAIEKAKGMIELKTRPGQISAATSSDGSFFIKTGTQKIIKIQTRDILFIESRHEYICIQLANENHVINYSLKGALEILPPDQFIQIHRSYVVNFLHIQAIEGNILVAGNHQLNIGKNYRDALMARVKQNSIGLNAQNKPLSE